MDRRRGSPRQRDRRGSADKSRHYASAGVDPGHADGPPGGRTQARERRRGDHRSGAPARDAQLSVHHPESGGAGPGWRCHSTRAAYEHVPVSARRCAPDAAYGSPRPRSLPASPRTAGRPDALADERRRREMLLQGPSPEPVSSPLQSRSFQTQYAYQQALERTDHAASADPRVGHSPGATIDRANGLAGGELGGRAWHSPRQLRHRAPGSRPEHVPSSPTYPRSEPLSESVAARGADEFLAASDVHIYRGQRSVHEVEAGSAIRDNEPQSPTFTPEEDTVGEAVHEPHGTTRKAELGHHPAVQPVGKEHAEGADGSPYRERNPLLGERSNYDRLHSINHPWSERSSEGVASGQRALTPELARPHCRSPVRSLVQTSRDQLHYRSFPVTALADISEARRYRDEKPELFPKNGPGSRGETLSYGEKMPVLEPVVSSKHGISESVRYLNGSHTLQMAKGRVSGNSAPRSSQHSPNDSPGAERTKGSSSQAPEVLDVDGDTRRPVVGHQPADSRACADAGKENANGVEHGGIVAVDDPDVENDANNDDDSEESEGKGDWRENIGKEYLSIAFNEKAVLARLHRFGALEDKLRVINLGFCGLSAKDLSGLVPFIVSFGKVKELSLENNKLESLPDNFARIADVLKLSSLTLQSNALAEFPHAVLKFEKLRILNLSRNKLKSVPVDLRKLVHLTILNLSRNEIESVPGEVLGVLENLHLLRLDNNKLQSLPDDIGRRNHSLKVVDVSGNTEFFGGFPESFRALKTQLQKLFFEETGLYELFPKSLRDCSPEKVIELVSGADGDDLQARLRVEPKRKKRRTEPSSPSATAKGSPDVEDIDADDGHDDPVTEASLKEKIDSLPSIPKTRPTNRLRRAPAPFHR